MPTIEETLRKSTEVAQKAAKSIGGTFERGIGFTPEPITSGELTTPVTPIKIDPVPKIPIPNVSNIPTIEPVVSKPGADDLTTQIEDMTAGILGRDTEKRLDEATIGPEKELAEINKRIKMLQADALEGEEKARERGETIGFATGEAARVRRNFAIEAIRLSALSEAMQGNVTFARQQAQSALDAEFKEEEEKLRVARKNLLDNYDSFTPAEKKRADAALLALDEQDAFVKEQKASRKMSEDIAIEVAATGKATNEQLDAIRNADPVEAARLSSEFLGGKAPAGDLGTFLQFFPGVDVTTPEGKAQFDQWRIKFHADIRKPVEPGTPTSTDIDILVNQFIGSKDFENAKDDEKDNYIRFLGGDPNDYKPY